MISSKNEKKNIKLLIFQLLVFLITLNISCSKSQSQTIISGNISNLPDGTLYLYEENGTNRIDSVNTKNGKFKVTYTNKNNEPVYLGINHIDSKGIFRSIAIPTHSKYKGAPLYQSRFLSDSAIVFNGEIFDNTPLGFPKTSRMFDLKKYITTGKQTEAFYNIDLDLFEKINDKKIEIIKGKINKYPYSYHLLYKIIENKNSFSPQQLDDFLKSFKGEITKSESYKKLLAYNQKRFTADNNPLIQIENLSGEKSDIIDKKFEKHLIVFWASWCGPCRAEIPLLKKTYRSKNPNTEFISISIDEDKNAWQKAAKQEQMSWKQFILDKNTPAYENYQIRLKFNSAIPYTVLVDSKLNVLTTSMGLGTEAELKKLLETQ